jgi:hypothetical protein
VEDADAAAEADEVATVAAEWRAALAASAFSAPKDSTQRMKSAAAAAAEEATMDETDPPSGCVGGGGDSPELVGASAMVRCRIRWTEVTRPIREDGVLLGRYAS